MGFETQAIIVPSQLAYLHIPTDSLRTFCDSFFPSLAKCTQADYLSGGLHRWRGGHDLLLSVDYSKQGWVQHVGHILCTDFPTKSGIPIPGLSKEGLGTFLTETCGIDARWINVNLLDTGIGIIAIAEGATDLAAAFNGTLIMNTATFFDTFFEGGIEITLACCTKNPFLLTAGIENILAGAVATYNRFSYYINPADFFGGALLSAFLGFTVSRFICKTDCSTALKNACRSGLIGGLAVVSPYFAAGGMLGISAIALGKMLAEKNNRRMANFYKITSESYYTFLKGISEGDEGFLQWYYDNIMLEPLEQSAPLLDTKNSGGQERSDLDVLKIQNAKCFDTQSELFDPDMTKAATNWNDQTKSKNVFSENELFDLYQNTALQML